MFGWLRSVSVVAALVTACVGCGSPEITDLTNFDDLHPVSGRVSFEGQPIPGASIRFHQPRTAAGLPASDVMTAIAGEDGGFEVYTYRADGRGLGAPVGEYWLSVSWLGDEDSADVSREDLPEKLPAKYTRPQTSGLKVTIASGGTVLPDIELKK